MASTSEEQAPTSMKGESFHDLHRSMVTIHVGPDNHPFFLHEQRLCKASSYFKTNLNSGFAESLGPPVQLDDVEGDAFELFEEWLYLGTFNLAAGASPTPSLLLVKAFCLGERLGVPDFQDQLTEAIRLRAVHESIAPTLEAVEFAYKNTAKGSPLQRLLVDIYAYNLKPRTTLILALEEYPHNFLAEVLGVALGRLPYRLPEEAPEFELTETNFYRVLREGEKEAGGNPDGSPDGAVGMSNTSETGGSTKKKKKAAKAFKASLYREFNSVEPDPYLAASTETTTGFRDVTLV